MFCAQNSAQTYNNEDLTIGEHLIVSELLSLPMIKEESKTNYDDNVSEPKDFVMQNIQKQETVQQQKTLLFLLLLSETDSQS